MEPDINKHDKLADSGDTVKVGKPALSIPSVSQPIFAAKFRISKAPLLFGIFIIMLAAVVCYGVYYRENQKVVSLSTQVNSLRIQSISAEREYIDLKYGVKPPVAAVKPAPVSTTKYLDITQLGIEIPLTSSISDLSYTWDSSTKSADLGSSSLAKEDTQENPVNCKSTNASNSNTYPISAVINSTTAKSNPNIWGAPNSPGGPVKTVIISGQEYYWYLPGASGGCTDPSATFIGQDTSYFNTALNAFDSAIVAK